MDDDAQWLVSLAEAAGRQAVPLFLAVLVAALAGTWLAWRGFERHAVPRLRTRLPPTVLVALPIAAGFAVIVFGGWVFAEVADEIGAEEDMGRADQALTNALRESVPLPVLRIFALLTHLGDTLTLTLLCIAVAASLAAIRRHGLALGWVFTVAGGGLLNWSLKQVFERIRPVHDHGLVLEDGFSFPSGHSSGSLVAYGMLAYLALRVLPPRWHLPAAMTAVALAVTVGASRVFLRVHFASDVLAGFASGAAWLAVCVASIEFTRWRRQA